MEALEACIWNPLGSGKKFERKKVQIGEKVELLSIRTFFLNFFLGFIWKQLDYKNGRPLILKLIPNDEESNNQTN